MEKNVPNNENKNLGLTRIGTKPLSDTEVWEDDVSHILNKKAEFYTNALLSTKECYVLNLNGAWGTGKTFFVERWAKDLQKKEFPVVIYNAWQNDCDGDPLVSLAAQIIDSLQDISTELRDSFLSAIGEMVYSFGKTFLKSIIEKQVELLIGKKVAHNVGHIAIDAINSFFKNSVDRLGNAYVETALRKKEFLGNFKKSLRNITEEFSQKEKQLFIFVDELDRCKPLFSIELLERIKHLFDVTNIKFIITSDNEQLCASIKSVYGEKFDAEKYLRRFFDITFKLPSVKLDEYISQSEQINIIRKNLNGKNRHGITIAQSNEDLLLNFLPNLLSFFDFSLRDINQIICRAFFIAENIKPFSISGIKHNYVDPYLLFFLCALYCQKEEYLMLYNECEQTEETKPISYWEKLKEKYFNSDLIKIRHNTFDLDKYFKGEDASLNIPHNFRGVYRQIAKKIFEAIEFTSNLQ